MKCDHLEVFSENGRKKNCDRIEILNHKHRGEKNV